MKQTDPAKIRACQHTVVLDGDPTKTAIIGSDVLDEAIADADDRNARAKALGLKAHYSVHQQF